MTMTRPVRGNTAARPGDLLVRDVRIVGFRSRRALAERYRLHRASVGSGPASFDPVPALARAARLRWGDAYTRRSVAGPPVDVRIRAGVITEVGPGLPGHGEPVLEAQGSCAIPGLWDAHVHLDLVAAQSARIDLSATRSPEEALVLVARERKRVEGTVGGRSARESSMPGSGGRTIQGFGFRLSQWSRLPTIGELDAVTGAVPTVLISGDVHSGWVNSAALQVLGLADLPDPMTEQQWFSIVARLDEVPGTVELREAGFRGVLEDALSRGITGIVDMTEPRDVGEWAARVERLGMPVFPRIRASIYSGELDVWEHAGLRTGDPLVGEGIGAAWGGSGATVGGARGDGGATPALVTQGALKIIVDGSLGTRSAWIRDVYPGASDPGSQGFGSRGPHGVESIAPDDLVELLAHARRAGFDVAVHAIGDAALEDVARAFTLSGARGRVEHAQLLPTRQGGRDVRVLEELSGHGVEWSVQPAHMLDDDATVDDLWPGTRDRCFALAEIIGAGGLLHLGSDAPVAPVDPWLAMATAVSRRMPGGRVWSPLERLTPEEALAASVDGQGPLGVGSRGDLVLVERDPTVLAENGADGGRTTGGTGSSGVDLSDADIDELADATSARLAAEQPVATVVAGRPWHRQ